MLCRLGLGILQCLPRSYKEAPAQRTDGFHLPDFGMLCDDGLQALGDVYLLMEQLCCLPIRLWLLVAAQLPRPGGGQRPIGVGSGPYWLLSKARREEADTWEGDHRCPYGHNRKDARSWTRYGVLCVRLNMRKLPVLRQRVSFGPRLDFGRAGGHWIPGARSQRHDSSPWTALQEKGSWPAEGWPQGVCLPLPLSKWSFFGRSV